MTHFDAAAPTPGGLQDTIRLTGLSARGYHGVYDSERAEGQIFIADLVLRLGAGGVARAAASDSLADAVDYAAVASAVVSVLEGEPVALIETLASRIADVTLGFAGVREVEVTVHKPQAPLEVAFEDVSVTITRSAGVTEAPPAAASGEPGSFTSIFGQVSRSDAAARLRPQAHSHAASAGDGLPGQSGLLAGAASAAAAAGLGGVLAAGAGAAEAAGAAEVAGAGLVGAGVAAGEALAEGVAAVAEDPVRPAWHALSSPAGVAEDSGVQPGQAPAAEYPAAADADGAGLDPAQEAPVDLPETGDQAEPGSADLTEPQAASDEPEEVAVEAVPVAEGEPVEADLVTSESAVPEPGEPELGESELAGPGLVEPVPVGSESAEPQPAATEPAESAEAEPAEPALAETDPEPAGTGAADLTDSAVLATAMSLLDRRPERAASAVIALGGNVGGVVSALRTAIHRLSTAEGVRVTDVAPLARTAPVLPEGAEPQPDYLNTVVLVETTLSPRELLGVCQGLEQEAGRVRLTPKGPRTLDADLIVYEGVTSQDEELILPHPRARERAFVLVPWAQANPFAEIGEESVAALAEAAPDREGLRWLALDWLDSDHLPALPTGQYVAPPLPPESADDADAPEGAEAAHAASEEAEAPGSEPLGEDAPVSLGSQADADAEPRAAGAADPVVGQADPAAAAAAGLDSDEPAADGAPALQVVESAGEVVEAESGLVEAALEPESDAQAGEAAQVAEPEDRGEHAATEFEPAADPEAGANDAPAEHAAQPGSQPAGADESRPHTPGSPEAGTDVPEPAAEVTEQTEAGDGVGDQDERRPGLALPEADDREWAAPPSWGDVMGGLDATGADGPDGAAGTDHHDASGR